MSYATSKTNQELIKKSESLKKVTEHARDYLTLTLTIPLGNKALKKVHTNQWLFTDLPKEFDLANWTILADALNANANRYEGYVKNRWYIEAVDISVEAGGKAEMKLTLNAFASSQTPYSEAMRDMRNAYTDAKNKQNNNNNNNNNANNSNSVTNKTSVINESNVKKYSIPDKIVNKIKSLCKLSNTDEANVKAWFNWMNDNVDWWEYTDHRYSEETVMSQGGGNCVDNSRLFRMGCLALGLKCNYVQGKSCCSGGECANHQWNKVYINGKGIEVDTGRQSASWGSHWGSCSGSITETDSSW